MPTITHPRARWPQLLDGIRRYAHAAWLANLPTTVFGAGEAVGELRERANGAGPAPTTPILTAFEHLEADGIAVRDRALSTRKTRVLRAWNWSGLPLEGQTLRTALEGFLCASETFAAGASPTLLPDGRSRLLGAVPEARRVAVLTAVRALIDARFGAGAAGPRGAAGHAQLLQACERIPAEDLSLLPDEVKRGRAAEAAEKYSGSLRHLLRYAAAHDLVVLFVPPPRHAHPWAGWAERHDVGDSRRPLLYALHAELRARLGNGVPASPDDVSAEQANTVRAALAVAPKRGSARAARELKALLVSLGVRGQGPYRVLARELSVQYSGKSFIPDWMLPAPPKGANDWAATVELLRARGCAESLCAFYGWMGDYSLLSATELRARHGVTGRPASRALDPKTTRQRHHALRVWVGIAVHELQIDAAACTPAVVFGARFAEIRDTYLRLHSARVETAARLLALGIPVPGHEPTTDAPTVSRDVYNAGLIAEGCVAWAKWEAIRGEPVATDHHIAAWSAAYDLARAESGMGDRRSRHAGRKDLSAILVDISSLAFVEGSNKRVLSRIEREPGTLATARTVQRALLGSIVSTGAVRIDEVRALTYAQHYRERRGQATGRTFTRFLDLCGGMRKADVAHEVPLIEELTPSALWSWHRDVGRALLMQQWMQDGNPPHDFVFCGHQDGGQAPEGALSRYYTEWRKAELTRHHSATCVAGTRGQHGPHASRNHVIALLTAIGEGDRAPFLVGHTSGNSTLALYSKPLAEANAETLRMILRASPWQERATADVDAPSTIHGAKSATQRAQAQLRADAAVGRDIASLLEQLDDLSPSKLQALMGEVRDKHRPTVQHA